MFNCNEVKVDFDEDDVEDFANELRDGIIREEMMKMMLKMKMKMKMMMKMMLKTLQMREKTALSERR